MPTEQQNNGHFWSSLLPTTDFAALDRDALPDSAKWQLAVSNALQQAAVGFLAAGAASLVLSRSSAARTSITAAGAGFGLGKSYVDMRYLFNHEVLANKQWVASVTRSRTEA
jgi:inner membrane organizing system protein 1